MWTMLRAQGVFVGRGPAPKVAFLYTGQGSQYVNMLQDLRGHDPVVAETFDEADRIMTPLLGRSLSSYIFVDGDDPAAVRELEQQLTSTEITQPAVLATDLALTRLLGSYGIGADMVMGHSLGEYGALVAAGAMTFDAALEAVSARGHEMASLSTDDNGAMAAVFGPLAEIERVVDSVDGNVVIANVNSNNQAVIGGATEAVERAVAAFRDEGVSAARIPVSHAFHTSIVAPVSAPLRQALDRLDLRGPRLPIVSNVTGDFYPTAADRATMLDLLGRQVASPVQFVRGLHTLYDAGARVFVEVGPRRPCTASSRTSWASTTTCSRCSPTIRRTATWPPSTPRCAVCGPPASGWPAPRGPPTPAPAAESAPARAVVTAAPPTTSPTIETPSGTSMTTDKYAALGRIFADAIEQGLRLQDEPAALLAAIPDGARPARAGGHHRRGAGPARCRARLRRREPAADPRRSAVHRHHPAPVPAADGRPARHTPGEA